MLCRHNQGITTLNCSRNITSYNLIIPLFMEESIYSIDSPSHYLIELFRSCAHLTYVWCYTKSTTTKINILNWNKYPICVQNKKRISQREYLYIRSKLMRNHHIPHINVELWNKITYQLCQSHTIHLNNDDIVYFVNY